MSTLEELKDYLLGKDEDVGYLLNDDNNGKTVMLSGVWGSGKTHFWQNDIAPELVKNFKDNNRACIYVSLYGKESLKAIKQEVFLKASDEKDYLSEEVETFGIDALASLEDSDANWAKILKSFLDLNRTRKGKKGQNRLKDGGIICFDDFERKSKKVDLNDLFGFISQLAIGLNCKVVIILNSDVFKGKEKYIFKTVKEKTVSKFFDFDPAIKELFAFIYESDSAYSGLDDYRESILSVLQEANEKNSRIYFQVLDNCLEWLDKKYDPVALRSLILNTICFSKHHFILSYPILISQENIKTKYVDYEEINYSPEIKKFITKEFALQSLGTAPTKEKISTLIERLKQYITGGVNTDTRATIKDIFQSDLLKQINQNKDELNAILKFGYELFVARGIDEPIYNEISTFIKSGILPKNNKEPSS